MGEHLRVREKVYSHFMGAAASILIFTTGCEGCGGIVLSGDAQEADQEQVDVYGDDPAADEQAPETTDELPGDLFEEDATIEDFVTEDTSYLTWAALIRRIFEDNPLRCPCGGEMRIVKFLTEPRECADYLEAQGLQVLTSNAKPARAPPEFCDGKLEDHRDFFRLRRTRAAG